MSTAIDYQARALLTCPVTHRPLVGSEEAYFREIIFRREYAFRLRVAARYSWIRDDLDDFVQDAYLHLWRAWKKNPIGAPKRYLDTIVRNLAEDRRRKIDPRLRWTDREVAEEESLQAESVEAAGRRTEELAWLNLEIAALPTRARQVVQSRYCEGHSMEETAKRLGMAVNTVNAHQDVARRTLKRNMKKRRADALYMQPSVVAEKEEPVEVTKALAQLPQRIRAVVKLRFGEGRSRHETGARLQMTPDLVHNYQLRAAKILRPYFEGIGLWSESEGKFSLQRIFGKLAEDSDAHAG